MKRRLRVLENPLMHDQPAGGPCVAVIFEPDEYDWWMIDERTADLKIGGFDTHSTPDVDGQPIGYRQPKTKYLVSRGMYAKVEEEDVTDEEPAPDDYQPRRLAEAEEGGTGGYTEADNFHVEHAQPYPPVSVLPRRDMMLPAKRPSPFDDETTEFRFLPDEPQQDTAEMPTPTHLFDRPDDTGTEVLPVVPGREDAAS